jgi:hypothetical protein
VDTLIVAALYRFSGVRLSSSSARRRIESAKPLLI